MHNVRIQSTGVGHNSKVFIDDYEIPGLYKASVIIEVDQVNRVILEMRTDDVRVEKVEHI